MWVNTVSSQLNSVVYHNIEEAGPEVGTLVYDNKFV